MSDFIGKMSKKSFRDPIMAVKRSRLSAPVSWSDFRGFPRDFYRFSFIFLSKIVIWGIFPKSPMCPKWGSGPLWRPMAHEIHKKSGPTFLWF